MKMLREIFNFYCKQHISNGKGVATFDNLGMNISHLSPGDWMCFNRDFGIRAKNKLSVKVPTFEARLSPTSTKITQREESS